MAKLQLQPNKILIIQDKQTNPCASVFVLHFPIRIIVSHVYSEKTQYGEHKKMI